MTLEDFTINGIPETMLWTLHNRANEALKSDSILTDTAAIRIYKSIKYDYTRKFGAADYSHAIRAVEFDLQIRNFLKEYPQGLVIGLGEGLETQCFRCDNGENRWLSVDIEEAMNIRERFIKPNVRRQHLAVSALDFSWVDMQKDEPVFITAQGLFMYFHEEQVRELLQRIDKKFSNYRVMFDTIPVWLSKKTIKGWHKTKFYKTPLMPWGINTNDIQKTIQNWLPSSDVSIHFYQYQKFNLIWSFYKWVSKIPYIKNKMPVMVLLSSENLNHRRYYFEN